MAEGTDPPDGTGETWREQLARVRAQQAAREARLAALEAAKGAVALAPRDERWYVAEWARRAAPVALRAAASALSLDVVPAVRWERLRRDGDMHFDPGLAAGVSRATRGYVLRGDPGFITIRADDSPHGVAQDDALLDAMLRVVGHECAHLWEAQEGLPLDRPGDEAGCDRVAAELLPRLRAAVEEAEERRLRGEDPD